MSSQDPKEQENQKSNLKTGGDVQTKWASKMPLSEERETSGEAQSPPDEESPSKSETGKDG